MLLTGCPVLFDGVVESPIYAPQEMPLGCKAQWFFSTPRAFPAGTIGDTFNETI